LTRRLSDACPSGAGPSGLVAAKSLLRATSRGSGSFHVTIFEAQSRIGGLWPSASDEPGGLIHPRMVTNQSRHSVHFSDLAWDPAAPEFPRAWQVGRYLGRYYERYCQEATLHLGTRVHNVEPLCSPAPGGLAPAGWRVQTSVAGGKTQQHTFDFLLVASGYFGKPAIPASVGGDHVVPVLHSSQYRHLSTLLERATGKGGKILVVGGQMSGIEIAGTIASQISSQIHSPSASAIPNPDKYSVHHVTERTAWVFPSFISPQVTIVSISASPKHLDVANSWLAFSPHLLLLPFCRWTSHPTTCQTGHCL